MRKAKKPMKLKLLPIAIALGVVLVIAITIMLITILSQNYIIYENIADTAVANVDASKANLIIVNEAIVGGVQDGKWISAEEMYEKNSNKKGIKVDMFSKTAKYGTFDTASLKYNKKSNIVYTTTTKTPKPEEYIALTSSNDYKSSYLKATEKQDSDIKAVKKALGKYRLFNNTINIIAAYDVFIEQNIPGRIIVVTSESNFFGTYSAIVYSSANNTCIVKYAYVKNSEKSISWPIYAANFAIDLDNDGTSELIIQETTETTTSYTIMKYEDKMFVEVLKHTIKL